MPLGGSPPFCQKIQEALYDQVTGTIDAIANRLTVPEETPSPKSVPLPIPRRLTVKELVAWVQEQFGIICSRETIRKTLKKLGFSWKKAKNLLGKADSEKRQKFLDDLTPLFADTIRDKCLLIYIDEAHIQQDTDLGYGWSIRGKRLWAPSSSPGLAKVSFYGLYLYNEGQVRIWPCDRANGEYTVDVLQRIKKEFPDRLIKLIWDGASYHRSRLVKDTAKELGIDLIPLPAYSPDFMPVESLWHWLREEVTYFFCHKTKQELIERVAEFEHRINQTPIELSDRLWVQNTLDPEVEKLRFSK